MGERNQFEVADKPVWLEVAIVAFCFTFFGTHEETYLAIYAAGVFILLSMTGWAVTKRLIRNLREKFEYGTIFLIGGTIVAALLTTGSTLIIFGERFLEGAWTYFIFIPILYATFSYFRRHMGRPSPEMEYVGMLDSAQLAGFGFGQYGSTSEVALENGEKLPEVTWQPDPKELSTWRKETVTLKNLVVLLDGSTHAARALPTAKMLCRKTGAKLHLLSAVKNDTQEHKELFEDTSQARKAYLENLAKTLTSEGYDVITTVQPGYIADATGAYLGGTDIDLVVLSTRGKSGEKHWDKGGASRKLVRTITKPILMVQAERAQDDIHWVPRLKRILVALDGSISSEQTLPYARMLAKAFKSETFLVSVPAIPSASDYRAPAEYLEVLRNRKDTNMRRFLNAVARGLRKDGLKVHTLVTGSIPAKTIVDVAAAKHVDLIMMTSRGRGGLKLLFMGSVAEQVVQDSDQMVFMMPIPDSKVD